MQGNPKNPRNNSEGYPNPTAYEAMRNVMAEENPLDKKVSFLIKMIKFIVRESGFELLNRIELKDTKTGRIFK